MSTLSKNKAIQSSRDLRKRVQTDRPMIDDARVVTVDDDAQSKDVSCLTLRSGIVAPKVLSRAMPALGVRQPTMGSAEGIRWADKDFVLAALQKDPTDLQYVAESLKQDRKFMIIVATQKPEALAFAAGELVADRDFMLEAAAANGEVMRYVGDSLRSDRQLIVTAAANVLRRSHVHHAGA